MTAVLSVAVALMFVGTAFAVIPGDESFAEEEESSFWDSLPDRIDLAAKALLTLGGGFISDVPKEGDKVVYIDENTTISEPVDYTGKEVVIIGDETAITVTMTGQGSITADAIYFAGETNLNFGSYTSLCAKEFNLGSISLISDDEDYIRMLSNGTVGITCTTDNNILKYIASPIHIGPLATMNFDAEISITAQNDIRFLTVDYTNTGGQSSPISGPDGSGGTIVSEEMSGALSQTLVILGTDDSTGSVLSASVEADLTDFYKNLPEDEANIPNILSWLSVGTNLPDVDAAVSVTDFTIDDLEYTDADYILQTEYSDSAHKDAGVPAYRVAMPLTGENNKTPIGSGNITQISGLSITGSTFDNGVSKPEIAVTADGLSSRSEESKNVSYGIETARSSSSMDDVVAKLSPAEGGGARISVTSSEVEIQHHLLKDNEYLSDSTSDTTITFTGFEFGVTADLINAVPLILSGVAAMQPTKEIPEPEPESAALAMIDHIKANNISLGAEVTLSFEGCVIGTQTEDFAYRTTADNTIGKTAMTVGMSADPLTASLSFDMASFRAASTVLDVTADPAETLSTSVIELTGLKYKVEASFDSLYKLSQLKTAETPDLESIILSALTRMASGDMGLSYQESLSFYSLTVDEDDMDDGSTTDVSITKFSLEDKVDTKKEAYFAFGADKFYVREHSLSEGDGGSSVEETSLVDITKPSVELRMGFSGMSALVDLIESEEKSTEAAEKFQSSAASANLSVDLSFAEIETLSEVAETSSDSKSRTVDRTAFNCTGASLSFSAGSSDNTISLSADIGSLLFLDSSRSLEGADINSLAETSGEETEVSLDKFSMNATGSVSGAKYAFAYLIKESMAKSDFEDSVKEDDDKTNDDQKYEIDFKPALSRILADTSAEVHTSLDGLSVSTVTNDGDDRRDTNSVKLLNADDKKTGNVTFSTKVTVRTDDSGIHLLVSDEMKSTEGTKLTVDSDDFRLGYLRTGQTVVLSDAGYTMTLSADLTMKDLLEGEDAIADALKADLTMKTDLSLTSWATIGNEDSPVNNPMLVSGFSVDGATIHIEDLESDVELKAESFVYSEHNFVWDNFSGVLPDRIKDLVPAVTVVADDVTLSENGLSASTITVTKGSEEPVVYRPSGSVQEIASLQPCPEVTITDPKGSGYTKLSHTMLEFDPAKFDGENGQLLWVKVETVATEQGITVEIGDEDDGKGLVVEAKIIDSIADTITEGKTARLNVRTADNGMNLTLDTAAVKNLVAKNAAMELASNNGGRLTIDASALKTLSDAASASLNLTVDAVSTEEVKAQVSAELAGSVEGKVVFSITNNAGVHELNGNMTFVLPYEQKDASKTVRVLYLNTETNALEEVDCTYDATAKTVTGTVDHMSLFAIDEVVPAVEPDDSDDQNGDSDSEKKSSTGIVIGVGVGVVAVIALAGAAFFLIRKR